MKGIYNIAMPYTKSFYDIVFRVADDYKIF